MKKKTDFQQLLSLATSRCGRTVAVSGLMLCSAAIGGGISAAPVNGGG